MVDFETINEKLAQLDAMQNAQEQQFIQAGITTAASIPLTPPGIPFLSRFVEETHDSSSVLISVLDTKEQAVEMGYSSSHSLLNSFYLGGVVLAAVDFIRIPSIYLAALILGQKPPITLNKNVRWLYSGVVFGLFLTSFLFPPAGLAIGFATGSLVFFVSAFLLGRTLQSRYNFKQDLSRVEQELLDLHYELEDCKKLAGDLAAQFEAIPSEALLKKIDALAAKFDAIQQRISNLAAERIVLHKRLDHFGTTRIMDKSFGLLLATAGIVGAALSVFIPPVGLLILTIVAGAGLSYLAARTIYVIAESLHNKYKKVAPEPVITGSTNSMISGLGVNNSKTAKASSQVTTTHTNPKVSSASNASVSVKYPDQDDHSSTNHKTPAL